MSSVTKPVLNDRNGTGVATRPRPAMIYVAALAVLGAAVWPMWRLLAFSLESDVYSYVILVPAISAYLALINRDKLSWSFELKRPLGWVLGAAGCALLAWYSLMSSSGADFAEDDRVAITTCFLVLTIGAASAWTLSAEGFRAMAFPLGFLMFMVPLPVSVLSGIEFLLQHGSAWTSLLFFKIVGTPTYYHDLHIQLPGMNLHVAPECSGIRSTLVLAVTSVLAGYLFLKRPAHRAMIAVAVIPIALLRNGLRIFTIGELCVHIGPEMIDSFIHRRGGPIFFAISLAPLFALLLALSRRERAHSTAAPASAR